MHRQLTQNTFATLADTQIIKRGTAISKPKSTNPLPNSTKKRIEPRQYDEAPQEAQTTQENGITACISLEDLFSYVTLKFSATQQRRALIDTGACANAISEKDYQELKSFGTPIATPSEVNKVKVASGQLIPVRGQIESTFSIAKHSFKEIFLVFQAQIVLYWEIRFSKTTH